MVEIIKESNPELDKNLFLRELSKVDNGISLKITRISDAIASHRKKTDDFVYIDFLIIDSFKAPLILGENGVAKTDIVEKATKHGMERLRERGFSQNDILYTKTTSNIKIQNDGAKVYIKKTDAGKFNIVVEGERGIITALKNIDEKSLERLTKNYNWR